MGLNITRHSLERYVERIKGISDKLERNTYITTNREVLEEHINTMFNNSECVYRGKVGGDNTTKNFYLASGDICLVVSDDSNLVTIFKINFEFPQEAKEYVIKTLVKSIKELEVEFAEKKKEVDESITKLEIQKEHNDIEIKELEARIKLLKDKNNACDIEKKNLLQETNLISYKQQRYAWQLFGNSDYKNDIPKR